MKVAEVLPDNEEAEITTIAESQVMSIVHETQQFCLLPQRPEVDGKMGCGWSGFVQSFRLLEAKEHGGRIYGLALGITVFGLRNLFVKPLRCGEARRAMVRTPLMTRL